MRLALLALLAGCASASPVMTADGSRGWHVTCRRSEARCLDKAAEVCPRGYIVLGERHDQRVTLTTTEYGATGRVRSDGGALTIRCRAAAD